MTLCCYALDRWCCKLSRSPLPEPPPRTPCMQIRPDSPPTTPSSSHLLCQARTSLLMPPNLLCQTRTSLLMPPNLLSDLQDTQAWEFHNPRLKPSPTSQTQNHAFGASPQAWNAPQPKPQAITTVSMDARLQNKPAKPLDDEKLTAVTTTGWRRRATRP